MRGTTNRLVSGRCLFLQQCTSAYLRSPRT